MQIRNGSPMTSNRHHHDSEWGDENERARTWPVPRSELRYFHVGFIQAVTASSAVGAAASMPNGRRLRHSAITAIMKCRQ